MGKAPTMQASLIVSFLAVLFAAPHLGMLTNVLEIFQHEGSAGRGMLNNPPGEDVIVVSASPKLFPAQPPEVALCRASAFGLQLAFQAEGAAFLFLPSLLSQEVTAGGDGRSIHPQVYPDHLSGRRDGRFRNGDNDVEGIAPLAIAQIGATGFVTGILNEVRRDREGQFNSPVNRRQTTGHAAPLDPVGTLVVADSCDLPCEGNAQA